ncbi:MAG: hypothetical protein ACTHOI_02645 [Sphingomicrobium sp.]
MIFAVLKFQTFVVGWKAASRGLNMKRVKRLIAIAALAANSPAPPLPNESAPPSHNPTPTVTPIPEDLALLQGKKVVVGRLALCVPNTFQPNLTYAGQTATVVGFKPYQMLNNVALTGLPPSARAMIENIRKGGTLLLQFGDGTKLDTCAPQGSNQLSPNLDLAPGETIQTVHAAPTVVAGPAAAAAAATQSCPVTVIKVSSGDSFGHVLLDAITTSEFQRQLDETTHGGVGKHYLDIQVRNDSGKPIKAFEFSAVYADKMGDESTSATFVSQNDKSIAAGALYKASAMDRALLMQNGSGEVTVYVARVRFGDDSFWQDNGSRSCRLKTSLK